MVLLVCRINEVMDTFKMVLEYFFVSWFVVFVWNYMVNPSSLDDTTTQFFWCASNEIYCYVSLIIITVTFLSSYCLHLQVNYGSPYIQFHQICTCESSMCSGLLLVAWDLMCSRR